MDPVRFSGWVNKIQMLNWLMKFHKSIGLESKAVMSRGHGVCVGRAKAMSILFMDAFL
jgi:hypothetical protein